MRRVPVLCMLLAAASPLHAAVCSHDAAPAASLLFPFVSFDYTLPYGGETTVLAVTNLSPEAQVVRVGSWTDLGIPVIQFNVVLAGYDVQRVNIRDILHNGKVPVTLSRPHSGFEGVLPFGPVSPENDVRDADWLDSALAEPAATDTLGDRCTPDHPGYPGRYDYYIPQSALDLLELVFNASRSALTLASNDCDPSYDDPHQQLPIPWYNRRAESTATWMYATVDVVESCSLLKPGDAMYWTPAGGEGEARYDNVLTGDAFWISADSSTAMPAVHLEADAELGTVATTNPDTQLPVSFYAAYSNSLAGISDFREPLPTAWALRYLGAIRPDMETRILLFKGGSNFITPYDIDVAGDELIPDTVTVSNCNAYTVYVWNEDSEVYNLSPPGVGPCISFNPDYSKLCPNLLPLVVQEVSVDEFYPVEDDGWMLFVWPDSNYGDLPDAPPAPDRYQTWMAIRQTAWGTHADYLQGTPVANANCFADQVLPGLGIDYDYVDEGGYRIPTGSD